MSADETARSDEDRSESIVRPEDGKADPRNREMRAALADAQRRPRPEQMHRRSADPAESKDGEIRQRPRKPILAARAVQAGEQRRPQTPEPEAAPRQKQGVKPLAAHGVQPVRSRLKDLDFVDLYVPLHANGIPRFNPKNVRLGEPGNIPLQSDYAGDLSLMREQLMTTKKEDFSLVHDDVRYRGSRARLANGEHWVCLRRISGNVPTLEQLKVDPALIPVIRGLGRRNGLIIVCGGTGQGKSTTANAILADYLDRIGHVAMTIEDPVEFNISGERGNGGYCFQVEVEDDTAWAAALKRALRWHPRYMLVGEIRSGAAAAQVLRAATSGHLVITTLHAGSVEKGIQAMIQVAENEIGSRAQDLVAEGISAVLHQTLTPSGPEISYLFTDPSGVDTARQYIRTGKLHMLNSYMEQQAIRMANEAAGRNADGSSRRG
jgi:twitching motility protein PilT